MQLSIRVSLVAEKDEDARKLKLLFEQFPEFVVVDTLAAGGVGPETVDVQVVYGEHGERLAALVQENVPTLYLIPDGSIRSNEHRAPNATLPPDAPRTQIRAAAMAVAAGLQITRKTEFGAADSESEFSFLEALTDRELHILNLVADGLSNPQIARRLSISRNTVKFHISSIISKLGATSRTEAVTIGVKRGLIIL